MPKPSRESQGLAKRERIVIYAATDLSNSKIVELVETGAVVSAPCDKCAHIQSDLDNCAHERDDLRNKCADLSAQVSDLENKCAQLQASPDNKSAQIPAPPVTEKKVDMDHLRAIAAGNKPSGNEMYPGATIEKPFGLTGRELEAYNAGVELTDYQRAAVEHYELLDSLNNTRRAWYDRFVELLRMEDMNEREVGKVLGPMFSQAGV